MRRNWFLVASLILYVASLALPVARDEGPPRPGFVYLVQGGYFLVAAPLAPANLLFLLGWLGLLGRQRWAAILLGVGALVVGVGGALVFGAIGFLLPYPAYYVWLASFVVLTLGAWVFRAGGPDRQKSKKRSRRTNKRSRR